MKVETLSAMLTESQANNIKPTLKRRMRNVFRLDKIYVFCKNTKQRGEFDGKLRGAPGNASTRFLHPQNLKLMDWQGGSCHTHSQ